MSEGHYNNSRSKTVLVVRYGAFGDMIMITPALRLLKSDGYKVIVNCNKYSKVILNHNPYVDDYLIHDTSIKNGQPLEDHWKQLKGQYDRFINLSGSIEQGLLPAEGKDRAYSWPHEVRHKRLNVNYYDRTLELCGYPDKKGLNGELYFSHEEDAWGLRLKLQYKNRFWILWSLSGSSFHKTYPYSEIVAKEFLDRHPDAMTMTVGDDLCRLLEWDHPQNKKRCGLWGNDIRKSLIACRFADLIVSPETGIANAAGCFSTPKIIMLSHSSVENLTKYWENCVSLEPENAPCYPCHQLHYSLRSCRLDTLAVIPEELRNEKTKITGNVEAPVCTTRISPERFLEELEIQYARWKERKNGTVKSY